METWVMFWRNLQHKQHDQQLIYDQIHVKVNICYSEISTGRSSILYQTADDKNLNITFNKADV